MLHPSRENVQLSGQKIDCKLTSQNDTAGVATFSIRSDFSNRCRRQITPATLLRGSPPFFLIFTKLVNSRGIRDSPCPSADGLQHFRTGIRGAWVTYAEDREAVPECEREQNQVMTELGKLLAALGAILVVLGLLFVGLGRTHLPLGHLPGDIHYHGKNGTFYFPLTTCILLSVILSAILYLINRLSR
jgi:hypothetical protein